MSYKSLSNGFGDLSKFGKAPCRDQDENRPKGAEGRPPKGSPSPMNLQLSSRYRWRLRKARDLISTCRRPSLRPVLELRYASLVEGFSGLPNVQRLRMLRGYLEIQKSDECSQGDGYSHPGRDGKVGDMTPLPRTRAAEQPVLLGLTAEVTPPQP